jgi:hypothetical protein
VSTPEGSAPSGGRSALDRASEETRRRSPIFFAVIALCFLLPFVSVECSGQRILTMKGLDLVTGAEPEISEDFEEQFDLGDTGDTGDETAVDPGDIETETGVESENDPNLWAIIALAAAIAGLILSLVLRLRSRLLGATITALIVFASLVILRFDISADTDEAAGIVGVEYRFGYWIALLLALVLSIAHVMELRRPSRAATTAGVPPAPPPSEPPGPTA